MKLSQPQYSALSLGLALLCLAQLVCWLPHYLLWPWWCDTDLFAWIAIAWDRGDRLPYRDIICNQLPAPIYVQWLIGRTIGWGCPVAFQAVDASLLLCLGAVLVAWSHRRFGSLLPALAAYAGVLSWYMSQGYYSAAQRDWWAAVLSALALLSIQGWPSMAGIAASAAFTAAAATVRPQMVLILPAIMLAVWSREGNPRERLKTLACWGALTVVFGLAAYAPILRAGLLGDMVANLRTTTSAPKFYGVTPGRIARALFDQVNTPLLWAPGLALWALLRRAAPERRQLAWPWLLALMMAWLWKPLSPFPHEYLNHPVRLFTALAIAPSVGLTLAARLKPTIRFALLILMLGLAVTPVPRFARPMAAWNAVAAFRHGEIPPPIAPPGYAARPLDPFVAPYAWNDYRRLLIGLRRVAPPGTTIANATELLPSINGMLGHPSPWSIDPFYVMLVFHGRERGLVQDLQGTPSSTLVVWEPHRPPLRAPYHLDLLRAEIQRSFEPMCPPMQYGPLEVWRRKKSSDR